jgi:aminoglycoside phosphotransferase family enzyme
MKQAEIEQLAASDLLGSNPVLKETHISWVILTEQYAWKIKKPLQLSFLDFSTLEKRKYYCQREVELNKRLADGMYIKTCPIFKKDGLFSFTGEEKVILDYTVLMKRMDTAREMDRLLENNQVSTQDIEKLAGQIAAFHQKAAIIREPFDLQGLQQKFADIETVQEIIAEHLGRPARQLIIEVIKKSADFLSKHQTLFEDRVSGGFIRDVHGDLHTANIFLTEEPVVFDCIEFNDQLRRIDVLDEVAFLCMDLEAYGHKDLAELFYQQYLQHFPMLPTEESRMLFQYYKYYRANIRAKVSALKIKKSPRHDEHMARYIRLMEKYLAEF